MAKRKKDNPCSSRLKRKQLIFQEMVEDKKDITREKRQKISERIKLAGIKPKNVYKVKLGDDLRMFAYQVTKIDRLEGIVYLKNERRTVRKVGVFDKMFKKPVS